MKTYLRKNKKSFHGDEFFGKVDSIPSAKVRNAMKKKHKKNEEICVLLPNIGTRTTIKNKWKKDLQNLD